MTKIRADLVDAYLFRRDPSEPVGPDGLALLQLRRAGDPLAGTWQPVMGHIEPDETAIACMWREVAEETGLAHHDVAGAWALEQVHPFFLADRDEIVLSPRFAVEVSPGWEPTLNAEHDAHRWVPAGEARSHFLWPGQHAAIAELLATLARPDRQGALRID